MPPDPSTSTPSDEERLTRAEMAIAHLARVVLATAWPDVLAEPSLAELMVRHPVADYTTSMRHRQEAKAIFADASVDVESR